MGAVSLAIGVPLHHPLTLAPETQNAQLSLEFSPRTASYSGKSNYTLPSQDPKKLCPILQFMSELPAHTNTSGRYIDYASVTLHGLVSLMGILENAAILYVVGCRMRQTVVTTWVLHLALSDLLATVSLPFFTYFLAVGHSWQLGTTFCKLHSSVFFLNMFASGFLLSAISLDRCLQVVRPIWAQNHRTVAAAHKVCLALWGLALLNTVPYFLFRDTMQRKDGRIMCYYNLLLYSSGAAAAADDGKALCGRRHLALAVSKFLLAFAVPLGVIGACYLAVSLRVRHRCRRQPSRFLRLVMAVIAAFVLCWLPYHVFSLLEAQGHHDDSLLSTVWQALPFVTSLAFINSVVNPFLYVLTCPDVLTKLRHSLRCVLESVLVEDSELVCGSSRRRRSSQGGSLSRSSSNLSSAGFPRRWLPCLGAKTARQPEKASGPAGQPEGVPLK